MIDKISGVYGIPSVNKISAKKSKTEEVSSGKSDGVEFSGFAKELAKASQELKSVPDVREELVEGFKRQVQEGAYSPDLDNVARSLLLAGLLNREE